MKQSSKDWSINQPDHRKVKCARYYQYFLSVKIRLQRPRLRHVPRFLQNRAANLTITKLQSVLQRVTFLDTPLLFLNDEHEKRGDSEKAYSALSSMRLHLRHILWQSFCMRTLSLSCSMRNGDRPQMQSRISVAGSGWKRFWKIPTKTLSWHREF